MISGNVGCGIELLSGATGTIIQNNEIGLALDANSALGNGGDGIYLSDSPSNQIGGTDQLDSNLIGSNHGNGINAQGASSNTLVEGNYIGTDVTATLNLGNQSNGIELASSSNTIGGTIGGAGNTIDYNGAGQSGLWCSARRQSRRSTRSSPTRSTRTRSWASTWATARRPTTSRALPGPTIIRTIRLCWQPRATAR